MAHLFRSSFWLRLGELLLVQHAPPSIPFLVATPLCSHLFPAPPSGYHDSHTLHPWGRLDRDVAARLSCGWPGQAILHPGEGPHRRINLPSHQIEPQALRLGGLVLRVDLEAGRAVAVTVAVGGVRVRGLDDVPVGALQPLVCGRAMHRQEVIGATVPGVAGCWGLGPPPRGATWVACVDGRSSVPDAVGCWGQGWGCRHRGARRGQHAPPVEDRMTGGCSLRKRVVVGVTAVSLEG
ncbi:hypothetical protein SEVIR_1G174050v4 [Setaria viridis]